MKESNIEKEKVKELITSVLAHSETEVGLFLKEDVVSLVYENYCKEVKDLYQKLTIIGKLDTFKKAACLMIGFSNTPIFETLNDSLIETARKKSSLLGVEAALLWIQKPIWNFGKLGNQPKALQEVDFEIAFMKDPSFMSNRKENLTKALLYQEKSEGGEEKRNCPLSIAETLYVLYYAALIEQDKVADFVCENVLQKKKRFPFSHQ